MAEMLLINPANRRKSRRAASPAQIAARKRFASMYGGKRSSNPKRRKSRRRNPASAMTSAGSIRRMANPRRRMRRRNPIRLGGLGVASILAAFKSAAIQGSGALAIDYVYSMAERFMPANLKRNPGRADIGDAIKAVATIVIGRALRGPTRGLSMQAATGALTVQAYALIKQQLPAGLVGEYDDGLGYANPAMVYDMSSRINDLNAYTTPGATPLLDEYTEGFDTPMLSGAEQEGFMR